MMIARFRMVGWVAGCAAAALCCYLASQRVASERLALAKVDRAIVDMRSDNARLQTEIATRSRMGQIERWNVAFRLVAPSPRQYLASEVQLAAYVGGRGLPLDPAIVASKGAVATVAYTPAAPAALASAQPAITPPPAPKLQTVAASAPAQPTMLHNANFVRPTSSRLASGDAAALTKVSVRIDTRQRLRDILDESAPKREKAGKPASLLPVAFEEPEAKPKPKRLAALLSSDLATLAAAESHVKPAKAKK